MNGLIHFVSVAFVCFYINQVLILISSLFAATIYLEK